MLLGWLGSQILLLLAGEGLWVLYCWGTRVVSPIASALLPLVVLLLLGDWSACTASAVAMGSQIVQVLLQPGEGAEPSAMMTLLHFFSFFRAMERGL